MAGGAARLFRSGKVGRNVRKRRKNTAQPIMTRHPSPPAALVVTRNLPPLIGGMERLVWHIVDALRADYRVHVIGPAGCGLQVPPKVTATGIPARPLWWFLARTQWATIRRALQLHPGLVFAGSGLTAPFAWLAARLAGAHCVVYLHGLDIEADHPLYRLLWRPFLRRCDRVFVNSRFSRGLAVKIGIDPARITILPPGVEPPDLTDAETRRRDFRAEHQLDDAPLMLYVGRITARKGLSVFVRGILPAVLSHIPNAKLVVIGDEPTQALKHRSGEKRRVFGSLQENRLGNRVLFLDHVGDSELSAAYFAADLLLFPVQDLPGDHEGFGMVAIEAAAHGLPTVAFAAGGVPDAVADGRSGRLIAPGDNRAFTEAVIDCLRRDDAEKRLAARRARQFAEDFSWTHFNDRFRAALAKYESHQR
ncbi:GDP-mannose-dependent alpha-(1-6)-phosphatidylinositol monomannoside mannosyltransferase [bacterium BMS3Bbin12]|nr:GDP-mannose-dependent alpha-(1-6)-phosphatidylinositol monomannoside mannosyltransferase [bacterium BMS3Bbin12]